MFLGPRAGSAIDQAKELEPNNPRVHLIDGIGNINKPSMFGGGTDKAIASLSLADSLFRVYQVTDSLYPDWGKVEARIWLAEVAIKEGKLARARRYLESAAAEEPENNWIRYGMMPKLQQKEAEAQGN
jgi:hypothetical protein